MRVAHDNGENDVLPVFFAATPTPKRESVWAIFAPPFLRNSWRNRLNIDRNFCTLYNRLRATAFTPASGLIYSCTTILISLLMENLRLWVPPPPRAFPFFA